MARVWHMQVQTMIRKATDGMDRDEIEEIACAFLRWAQARHDFKRGGSAMTAGVALYAAQIELEALADKVGGP